MTTLPPICRALAMGINEELKKRKMKTTKFRGKRLDTMEWTVGSLVKCFNGKIGIVSMTKYSKENRIEAIIDEVFPDTIGQYTGLKDKDGKEIWEGDIFKEDNSGIVRSVFRVPGGLAFEDNPVSFGYDHRVPVYPYSSIAEMQNASWLSQCCEIIGNIHDSPELLKGGEK